MVWATLGRSTCVAHGSGWLAPARETCARPVKRSRILRRRAPERHSGVFAGLLTDARAELESGQTVPEGAQALDLGLLPA